jgi:hypothetical protein
MNRADTVQADGREYTPFCAGYPGGRFGQSKDITIFAHDAAET